MDSAEWYVSKLRFQFLVLFTISAALWFGVLVTETWKFIFVIGAVVSLGEAVGVAESMKNFRNQQRRKKQEEKDKLWVEVCIIEEERRINKGE